MPLLTEAVGLGPGTTPREHALDAIYRMAGGLDYNDEELFCSAFVEDVEFDNTDLSRILGQEMSPINGLQALVAGVLARVGPLATGHQISNTRVKLEAGLQRGEVSCLALAQHKATDQGQDPAARGLVFGNHYRAEVVKTGDGEEALWKVKKFVVK